MQLCATYLTRKPSIRIDPVARFHLGNGARLERINWLGNTTPRGIQEHADFMYKIGTLKHRPESWKDLFWENMADKDGS